MLRSHAIVGGSGEVAVFDDLRTALHRADVNLVLLADPGDFAAGGHDPDDVAAITACRQRGAKILTLEPMPSSPLQRVAETADRIAADASDDDADEQSGTEASRGAGLLDDLESAGVSLGPASAAGAAVVKTGQAAGLESGGGWARFAPPLRLTGPMRSAAELIEQAGELLAFNVECVGAPSSGSLGARLFDAVDVVVELFGVPERVDAAFVWHDRPRSVHSIPGESLRGLDGDFTGHLRFADGRSGTVLASNRGGAWRRELVLICERGRLRINDRGLEWLDADGSATDRSESAAAGFSGEELWAVALAEQIQRAMDPRVPPPRPTDYARVLSVTGAMLLSARTGEGESPATLLRMAGRG